MTLLPILGRELRVRARNRGTYWTRFAVGLMGVVLCLQAMTAGGAGIPFMQGRAVFNLMVGGAFVVCCCACLMTADAISGEQREGTLSLLFLTQVKSVDVTLGKLGSIGITTLCAVVAFLPVLMIPLIAGGLTGGEAFRKGLALLDTVVFALAAGLCASAAQRQRFKAVRNATGFMVLLTIVPFYVFSGTSRGLFHALGLVSPLVLITSAAEAAYAGTPGTFWSSLLIVQILAWVLVFLAGLRLQHAIHDDVAPDIPKAPEVTKSEPTHTGLGSWQPVKGESTAVEWLVYRQSGISAGLWALALLGLGFNGWVTLAFSSASGPPGPFTFVFTWPLGITAGLIGGAVVAWVASRFFVAVRRTGELELFLTTPLGAQTIVSEQWQVLKRLFVWPALVMQAPMLPQLLGLLGEMRGDAGAGFFLIGKLLSLGNAFLGAAALCWLGLWFGLRARNQATAIAWAVGLAKGLPGLLAVLASLLTIMLAPAGRGGVGLWCELITLLFYLWLLNLARTGLTRDLAGAAVEPLTMRR